MSVPARPFCKAARIVLAAAPAAVWFLAGGAGDGAAAQDYHFHDAIFRRLDALEEEKDRLAREVERLEHLLGTTAFAYRAADGQAGYDERHWGPATFAVSGSRLGDAAALELDQEVVLARCADAEGCLVSMALEGATVAGDELKAAFPGEPCTLDLDDEDGHWAISSACAPADAGPVPPVGDDRAWGHDGDDKPRGQGIRAGRVILSYAGVCFLAEARPDTRPGSGAEPRLERDTNRGLFLVAAGPAWDIAGSFPAGILPTGPGTPDFHCRLSIRD